MLTMEKYESRFDNTPMQRFKDTNINIKRTIELFGALFTNALTIKPRPAMSTRGSVAVKTALAAVIKNILLHFCHENESRYIAFFI